MSKQGKTQQPEKIDMLLKQYGKGFSKPFGWVTEAQSKSIKGIIEHTGETEFADYYQFSSMQIHASSFSINKSILHQDGFGNTEMIGAFTEDMALPFNLVIKLMSVFIELLSEFFLSNEVKKLVGGTNKALAGYAAIQDREGR